MKKYLLYIAIFLIGAVAGMWLFRSYHFRDEVKMVQRDTIVRFDTIRYSSLELTTNRSKLNIPAVSVPKFVNIPSDSVTIIYRDSVRYVTLPRQYFHTKTEDAEIWHSGVDSTIDSLSLLFPITTIAQEKTIRMPKKHAISMGIEASYSTTFNIPVQLEYTYNVKPWLSVYGYAEYELFRKQFGMGGGMKLIIEY